MASVVSVGGIATILRESEVDAGEGIEINIRLFAKHRNGMLAIDPAPQTLVVHTTRAALGKLREPSVLARLYGDLSSAYRLTLWGPIVKELNKTGVMTAPETLQALPFELLLDGELQDLLDQAAH